MKDIYQMVPERCHASLETAILRAEREYAEKTEGSSRASARDRALRWARTIFAAVGSEVCGLRARGEWLPAQADDAIKNCLYKLHDEIAWRRDVPSYRNNSAAFVADFRETDEWRAYLSDLDKARTAANERARRERPDTEAVAEADIADVSPAQPASDPELSRRRDLWNEYVAATASDNKRGFCKAAHVDPGSFYDWLKGNLSKRSKTSRKIEQFLVKETTV